MRKKGIKLRNQNTTSKSTELLAIKQVNDYVNMRQAGLTIREIAAEMNVHQATVYKLINRAYEEYATNTRESLEAMRQLELDRYDDLYRRALQAGNIDQCIRVSERRCRLMGIDLTKPESQSAVVNIIIPQDLVESLTGNVAQPEVIDITNDIIGK